MGMLCPPDNIQDDGGPLNVGVNEHERRVTYQVPENLKSAKFAFKIEPDGKGQEQACVRISSNSDVIHTETSKPFPIGAIQKKSATLRGNNYVIDLNTQKDIQLRNIFSN